MSYTPYLIADYKTGLDTDQAPWLLPQDAFTEIQNGFIRHGIIHKREGFELFGTLAGGTQVTGIYNFTTDTGGKEIIATNTTNTFRFNTGTQLFEALTGTAWTSSNYTWFANFGVTGNNPVNKLYITNNFDSIRTYTTGSGLTNVYQPNYSVNGTTNPNDVVAKCLMIFVLKNRLVLLNTFEGNILPGSATQKPQRARWSQSQDPTVWDQTTPGRGGFVDAPTGDFIIGARFLQEYIVVFFSNSTWTLKPTSDPALPFRWDKLNNYRACDATFSTISHDRYVISYGKTGIVGCDGIEVKRIDDRIQDFMMDTVNVDKISQMYSDRNFTTKRSWTLFPSGDSQENNQALIRSEENGSWSIYDITLSCLGQGESYRDLTFLDFDVPNMNYTFNQLQDEEWDDWYFQSNNLLFLGGDYEGNIYTLETGGDDDDSSIELSLTSAGWNPFKQNGTEAQLGWIDIYADMDPQTQLTVNFFQNDEIAPYASQVVNLVPEIGFIASIQNVSTDNPCEITADSNGLTDGQEIFITGANGAEINGGPYVVSVVDENTFTVPVNGSSFATYTGGGIVSYYDPSEFNKVWKRIYAGGTGYTHQVQIINEGIDQTVQIHSITPWFRQVRSRMLS